MEFTFESIQMVPSFEPSRMEELLEAKK